VDVLMMHYFKARQFFYCLAHHPLHRIASSGDTGRHQSGRRGWCL